MLFISDKQFGEIAGRYAAGETLTELASDYGCCTASIYKILKATGTPTRRQGPPYKAARDDRIDAAVDLRNMGESLEEIGRVLGVTREYVRQLLLVRGIRGCRPKNKPLFPIRGFRNAMTGHLRACGYRSCQLCDPDYHPWLPAEQFSPKSKYICRACNTIRMRSSYQRNPAVRESMARWQRENPEKVRQYQARHHAKKQAESQFGTGAPAST